MDHVRKYAKITTSRLRRRDKTAGLSVTSWPIAAGEWCYRPLLAILSGLKAELIDNRLCDETDPSSVRRKRYPSRFGASPTISPSGMRTPRPTITFDSRAERDTSTSGSTTARSSLVRGIVKTVTLDLVTSERSFAHPDPSGRFAFRLAIFLERSAI
jgi:hypothetical protein